MFVRDIVRSERASVTMRRVRWPYMAPTWSKVQIRPLPSPGAAKPKWEQGVSGRGQRMATLPSARGSRQKGGDRP
jgi:hypothetical protein